MTGSQLAAAPRSAGPGLTLAANELGFNFYLSPAQVITAGGLLTLAHGFGVAPRLRGVYLVCDIAEGGYAVGEEVNHPVGISVTTAGAHRGVSIRHDFVNLTIRYGSNANSFELLNATTGSAFSITNANWSARFWALR